MQSQMNTIARAIVCIILTLAFIPLAQAQESLQQRASQAVEDGRYGEAVSILNQLITPGSGNVEALMLRARAYEGRGELDRSIQDYERVLQLTPNNSQAQNSYARVRASYRTQQEQRIQQLREEVANRPNNAAAMLQYADLLYQQQQFQEAANYYGQYLQIGQATLQIVQRYLISIAGYPGDHNVGEQVAMRYLAQFPNSDDLHMRLGYFRQWQGKATGAREAFNRALELNPANQEARQGLGQVREPVAPTISPIDRLLSDLRDNPAQDEKRFELAAALAGRNRAAEAFEQLRMLVEVHGHTQRWYALFEDVDQRLNNQSSTAGLFLIERLQIRLQHEPANRDVRYALVDALTASGRIVEAYAALTEDPFADPEQASFQQRINAIMESGPAIQENQLAALEQEARANPNNEEAQRGLIEAYLARNEYDKAFSTYDQVLKVLPEQTQFRFEYAQALFRRKQYARSVDQLRILINQVPDEAAYRRLFVLASIAAQNSTAAFQTTLDELLTEAPNDAGFLVDLADVYLLRKDYETAERYLNRALETGNPAVRSRTDVIAQHLDRAAMQVRQAQLFRMLNEARLLRAQKAYESAVDAYHAYFEARNQRDPEELKELALTHWEASDYAAALALLTNIQAQQGDVGTEKLIARVYMDAQNFEAAVNVLESLSTRLPRDYEVKTLLCDAYRENQRTDDAETACRQLIAQVPTSRIGNERMRLLKTSNPGYGSSIRIIPNSDMLYGTGSRTSYQRWSRGATAQVQFPIPLVFQLGYSSVFLEGSRRLIPDAETVQENINQFFVGGFIDFTPPQASLRGGYTNRLSFRGGIYDYGDERRASFGQLRYDRQVQDKYRAALMVLTDEGSIALWSPAGGVFDLRLTQMQIELGSTSLLPESALWLEGLFTLNIVDDNFGSAQLDAFSNYGTNVDMRAGYKVMEHMYMGLSYNRLSYNTAVDIYYAPSKFQNYNIWALYETSDIENIYFRIRGLLGVTVRARGIITRQIESTLAYRLMNNLTFALNLSAGQSHRPFASTSSRIDGPYSVFYLQGSLNWDF